MTSVKLILEKLTEEEKNIIEHCKSDPIWFIETFTQLKGKPFILFEYQKRLIKTIVNNKYVVVLKPRQMGISQTTGSFCLWYALFHPKKEIVIFSITTEEASYFLEKRILDVYDSLPPFLRTPIHTTVKSIEFEETGSKIEALASRRTALRGRSPSMVIIDEAAFQPYAAEMLTSAMPSLQLGEHLILISTPNGTQGIGEYFYNLWQKSVNKETDFYPFKIHWWENPLYNPQAPQKVDWQENEWATKQRKNYINKEDFEQEILAKFIDKSPEMQQILPPDSQFSQTSPQPTTYVSPNFLKNFWKNFLKDE